MKWIGLTGGLAAGKSTVARLLREKGYPVIDADEIAKKVVAKGSTGLAQVIAQFGQDLLLPDGELNRRELGRRVFGNEGARLKLEALIHPLVQDEVAQQRRQYQNMGFRLAFYDVPLLYEKNIGGFDAVLVVSASPDTQRARMKDRDGLSDDEIKSRLASQIPTDDKEKKADFVLRNDGDLAELERKLDDILTQLT